MDKDESTIGALSMAAGETKSTFKVRDKVRIIKDKKKVKKLQKNHGGWTDMIQFFLGKCGKVKSICPNNDLIVNIMGNMIKLNPECVKKVESTSDSSDDDMPDMMKMMKQMAKMCGQDDSDKSDKSDKSDNEDNDTGDTQKKERMRLFFAVKTGDMEQTKALVDRVGANVSQKKIFPLIVAVSEGHDSIVELLLSKGANKDAQDKDGDSSLHIAVQKNRLEICKILVDKGANVNVQNKFKVTPVMLATILGSRDILEYLVSVEGVDLSIGDKDKDTALHLAIQKSRLDSVEILLKAGASIEALNEKQFSSYHMAALVGHEKILEAFLKSAGPTIVDLQKEDKFAAIHLAAMNNHPGCLKMLVRYNANLNIQNSVLQTSLHIAVSQKYFDCVKILVESKAELNLKDESGDTPLHNGVRAHNMEKMKKMGSPFGMPGFFMMMQGSDSSKEIVTYLAEKGARMDIKNNSGKTAISECMDDVLRAELMKIKETSATTAVTDDNQHDLASSDIDKLKQKIKEIEEQNLCKICSLRQFDCAFMCGHVTCEECATTLKECRECSEPIKDHIKIRR